MIYKCLNNEAPFYIKELLKMAINRNTHSSDNFCELQIPRVSKKTFVACSFAYMGPKLWNNTPTTIREIASVDNFKSQLKAHLFNKYLVNNCEFVYY